MHSYPKVKLVLRGIFYISTEETMRKYRFLSILEESLPALRTTLKGRRLQHDEIDTILSDAVHGLVTRKDHNKFEAKGIEAHLRRAVLWQAHKYYRDNTAQAAREIPLAEPSEDQSYAYAITADKEPSEDECPFCHVGMLNVHGACQGCHTIVPRRASVPRPQQRIDEMATLPQIELTADVLHALQELDPHERTVIEAVVMGNDSLETLAAFTDTERNVLWRRCSSAFAKLREKLAGYAPPKEAMLRAVAKAKAMGARVEAINWPSQADVSAIYDQVLVQNS